MRGALGMAMIGCFVFALKRMPLSTAYTIYFVAPLLVAALSVPLLGEKVGPRRWTATRAKSPKPAKKRGCSRATRSSGSL